MKLNINVNRVGRTYAEKVCRIKERVSLLFLCSPGNVVRPRCCAVLLHQLLDDFTGVVQLVKVVLEHVLLPELLQEGFAFSQLVVLSTGPLEQLWHSQKKHQR